MKQELSCLVSGVAVVMSLVTPFRRQYHSSISGSTVHVYYLNILKKSFCSYLLAKDGVRQL